MERSESIAQLAAALAKAQSQLENPAKTAHNTYLKSDYAPLEEYHRVLRPIGEHGLSYVQNIISSEVGVCAETHIFHESGEYLVHTGPIIRLNRSSNNSAADTGAASTYAKRYGLSSAFGLMGDADTDARNLEGSGQATPAKVVKLDPKKVEERVKGFIKDINGATTVDLLVNSIHPRIKTFLDEGNAQYLTKLQGAWEARRAALEVPVESPDGGSDSAAAAQEVAD